MSARIPKNSFPEKRKSGKALFDLSYGLPVSRIELMRDLVEVLREGLWSEAPESYQEIAVLCPTSAIASLVDGAKKHNKEIHKTIEKMMEKIARLEAEAGLKP